MILDWILQKRSHKGHYWDNSLGNFNTVCILKNTVVLVINSLSFKIILFIQEKVLVLKEIPSV